MNRVLTFAGLLVSAGMVFAQAPSVVNTGPRLTPPAGVRSGNILFPGGVGENFANRLGNTVSGSAPARFRGDGRGNGNGIGRSRTVVVPYGVPIYSDPGYYGQQQQPGANVTVIVPQQPTPSAVINQGYMPETANPQMRVYTEDVGPDERSPVQVFQAPTRQYPNPEPRPSANPDAAGQPGTRVIDEKPTIFLLALKDSTVHSAIGYWADKGMLNYVTLQGTVSKVPLDQLDRNLTIQLNAERKVDFDINLLSK